MNNETFRELLSTDDWREAHEVLRVLRPTLGRSTFLQRREELQRNGYRLFGLFETDRLMSVAGVLVHPHLERPGEFWIHDLATRDGERSKGHGTRMLHHLACEAANCGCPRLVVHTRVEREEAHRFYEERGGFKRYAFVYERPV